MVAEIEHILLTASWGLAPSAVREEQSATEFDLLVSRARAGDGIAFEQIMLATEKRVVSIAWRMLGNRDHARDVTQEVYLKVFKHLQRFREGKDFNGWLYRITVNVCRDFSRKQRAGDTSSFDDVDFDRDRVTAKIQNGGGAAEDRVLRSQQLALVRRALRSLPEKERTALILRDLEGLSTEEVASALGTAPGTIRSQISSARAKIKTYCERLSRKGGAI